MFVTLDAVKRTLRKTDIDRDSDILASIAAAEAAVKTYCGRDFATPAINETRKYRLPDGHPVPLLVDDIADSNDIQISTANVSWLAGDEFFAVSSERGSGIVRILILLDRYHWREVADNNDWISVTANYGWPEVPPPVIEATKLWAARLFKRQDSGEAVMGMIGGDIGDARYIRSVDPDIGRLLSPYAGRKYTLA